MTSNKIINEIKSYVLLSIGLAIGTLGWTGFLIPAKIVGGGLTGVATIIYFITGLDVGLTALVMNVILILIAMRVLGASFGIKTIYCVLLFSGLLSIMRPLFPEPIVSETMMNTIIGGILAGIGAGIVFINGGSTGGIDIIAMIINKYKNISLGRLLLSMDVIIISSSFFLVQTSSIEIVVYGFMTMAIAAFSVDLVISGNKQTVQFFIISKKHEEIQKSVLFDAKRGLTVLHGTGGYSGEDQKVLMVIAKKSETQMIFRVIKQIDPNSFITVGTVMGVYGQGFDKIKI